MRENANIIYNDTVVIGKKKKTPDVWTFLFHSGYPRYVTIYSSEENYSSYSLHHDDSPDRRSIY